jgi:hypothetical protein
MTGTARVHPAVWEEHVARLRRFEPEEDVAEFVAALRELKLRDEADRAWSYDGATWWRWDGGGWATDRPTSSLALTSVELDVAVPHLPDVTREALGVTPTALPPPVATPLPPPSPARRAPAEVTPQRAAGLRPEATPPFVPTHRVPDDGMAVWAEPDPVAAPVAALDPELDVMAVEWRDDGWTRIVCSNTWSGWVDGRLLVRRT